MAEPLQRMLQAIAARPAAQLVGWRDGIAVDTAAFLAGVAAWRALLARTGGQHFALALDDSIAFGAALLGAWQAGKTIWLTADVLPARQQVLARSVDGFLGEFPAALQPLQPALQDAATPFDDHIAASTGPLLVVHTSGSTGAAQAVPKHWAQLSSEIATLETVFGARLGSADIVATVSHQHIYGLLFKVLWPLSAGRAIHAHSAHFPDQLAGWMTTLMATRDCVLVASPAHLKRWPAHLDLHRHGTRLRAVFSSGGPLPADTAQATAALLGQVPIEVYGSSETGGIGWRQRSAGADESWQPLPQVEWRIDAGDGLLAVRSPHLPDTDWLVLADRVCAAAHGKFVLDGRADRLVKIEEKRISLDAIETLLTASPLVADVRVLACDEQSGQRQRLAAFVVLTVAGKRQLEAGGKPALNRHFRTLLVDTVQAIALPRRWRYPERMPLDAQGKTTRAALLALLDPAPVLPQIRLVEVTLEGPQQRAVFALLAPANLLYFDGHFPHVKILPGVVQVDWAIDIGRRHFALPPTFAGIHALKFQRVIGADMPFTLELLHDVQKGSLAFRYFSDHGQHASGRVLFTGEVADD